MSKYYLEKTHSTVIICILYVCVYLLEPSDSIKFNSIAQFSRKVIKMEKIEKKRKKNYSHNNSVLLIEKKIELQCESIWRKQKSHYYYSVSLWIYCIVDAVVF